MKTRHKLGTKNQSTTCVSTFMFIKLGKGNWFIHCLIESRNALRNKNEKNRGGSYSSSSAALFPKSWTGLLVSPKTLDRDGNPPSAEPLFAKPPKPPKPLPELPPKPPKPLPELLPKPPKPPEELPNPVLSLLAPNPPNPPNPPVDAAVELPNKLGAFAGPSPSPLQGSKRRIGHSARGGRSLTRLSTERS